MTLSEYRREMHGLVTLAIAAGIPLTEGVQRFLEDEVLQIATDSVDVHCPRCGRETVVEGFMHDEKGIHTVAVGCTKGHRYQVSDPDQDKPARSVSPEYREWFLARYDEVLDEG